MCIKQDLRIEERYQKTSHPMVEAYKGISVNFNIKYVKIYAKVLEGLA